MPLWLYQLPNWLLGTVIVLAWICVGLGGHALVQRFVKPSVAEADRNLALALLAVVATVNSLLLAFSAISVWEAFGNADQAVRSEANAMSQLGRDLAVFNTAESRRARERLQAYASSVVEHEWPAMQVEQDSEPTWDAFESMFRAIGDINPATSREMALMPEIWLRGNELVKFRRNRLDAGKGQVPGTLWAVVVFGTLLTLAHTCVLPRTAFNRTMVGLLSLSMGLVFFFVAAMDRPFVGKESVSSAPIESSLKYMHRWDGPSDAKAAATSSR